MADELNRNAEFNGKHKDEEDPIFVAQRYLNIYHQLHIFNEARRKEFDDNLLALPSDVRILLSTLPGGSILLEHIAEVEEKRGIVSSLDFDTPKIESSTKRKKQGKESLVKDEQEENDDSPAQNAKQTGNVNISNSVLKMLKRSEEKHEKDMQALTNAFLQSQENMTNMLKEVLIETRNQPTVIQQITPSQMPNTQFQADSSNQQIPEEPHQKSNIFNFTKKLFSSHKSTATPEETEIQPINPMVDNTPVSLDDITDAPVALDDQNDDIVQDTSTDAPQKDIEDEQTVSESNNAEESVESGDDSEWDWEYVEEDDDDNTNSETSDEEWEYVEEPIEETQTPTSDEGWEYVEEPVKETQESASDDEWEYVEEPVGETQNPVSEGERQNAEEPLEEPQEPSSDGEWEYVEEPVGETQNPVSEGEQQNAEEPLEEPQEPSSDDEWEYTEEPFEETQNPVSDDAWEYAESSEAETPLSSSSDFNDENLETDNEITNEKTQTSEEKSEEMDKLFEQFLTANDESQDEASIDDVFADSNENEAEISLGGTDEQIEEQSDNKS